MQLRASIRNPAISVYLLRHNEAILQTFNTAAERRNPRSISRSERGPRHQSPVKAVASLFGSTRDSKPLPAPPPAAGIFSDIANLRPSLHNRTKSEAAYTHIERTPSKARLVRDSNGGSSKLSPLALEQTFDSYVLALHARKGNVVGRNVTNRKFADEALVNELYNVLLDEPQNAIAHEQAAQSQVDVLFAAFEKFLHNAWDEQMGALIPRAVLIELQSKADTLSPGDYEEFLQQTIGELAPQNQRALIALIGVLIDLMEGTPNDGDRGALMMAVTEMIVHEKNAHDYMSIFDRLVEDYDTIAQPGPSSGRTTPINGSMASAAVRSTNTGSLSSKASSFGRRFGRGILNRQNSKTGETGSMLGSFRGWSRTAKSPGPVAEGQQQSVLDRARSVDLYHRSANSSRPGSRDRPQFLSAFDPSSSSPRPQSGHSVEPLAKPKADGLLATPRSKRRSSLSDITTLPAPNMSPLNWTPSAVAWSNKKDRSDFHTASRSLAAGTQNDAAKARPASIAILASEESLDRVEPLRLHNRTLNRDEDAFFSTARASPTKAAKHVTKVTLLDQGEASAPMPVPRGILSERPASGNTPPPARSTSNAEEGDETRKPRTLNPLKQHLESQQEAIAGVKSGLKGELAKLGEDFSALGWVSSSRNGPVAHEALSPLKEQKLMTNIGTRLKALETKIPYMIGNLERSLATLEADMSASLKGSERRIRMLENELRDTNAVNEELFKSTQEELTKIFKRVKAGDGLEAIKDSLSSSQQEAEQLRAENLTMKKELAQLRERMAGS